MTDPLLTVDDLSVVYPGKGWRAKPFPALRGVSLRIAAGRTVGLVGESGSGKTTLGRAVLGLAPVSDGRIAFDGDDITRATRRRRLSLSRDIQVVFQDPFTSLNPSMTISEILAEPLIAQGVARIEARRTIGTLLDQVGLPTSSLERLPREFSGGQRQRIAIARALALEPRLIVCDEPVSALDLTTQRRVLDLLVDIQHETGVAYLFVSHDLDVVRHISHDVAVMYRGGIVEQGSGAVVTSAPVHPYTRRLFFASPVPDPDEQQSRRERRRALVQTESQVVS
ncbi:ABC transporter ATP-binding protein [Microbacterium resistens]|uniref:ATP-binding cassette domain-containing protein n=1 Tax=Microbacterium resistens TaxID=156977 RepID=UPI001C56A772|nr:ATP-binding cassette domain-containing protein [Microbacterium resistens]MBW1638090.1 ABC transporter ATP-binding protein [Microbacterium resistens]